MEELAARKLAAQDKIRETVHLEAAAMVGDGTDGSKLARKRERAEGALKSASAMLSEMWKFEADASDELKQAEADLEGFLNDRLAEGRASMKAVLDIVQNERGRQLGSLRHGEVIQTPRPNKSSKSRIAVCESCQADIAIIRDDARQPLTAESFEKLPRYDHLPFKPGQEVRFFLCPVCGKTPWLEEDRILTNRGYRMVSEPEQQDPEETTTSKEE